jgi:hypothetical protein
LSKGGREDLLIQRESAPLYLFSQEEELVKWTLSSCQRGKEKRPTARGESDSAANKRWFFKKEKVIRERSVDEKVIHS